MTEILYRRDLAPEQTHAAEDARALWEAAREALPEPDSTPSREEQVALERLRSAYDREHEALGRWTDLAQTREPGPTVVVVHRHSWLRDRLGAALGTGGWQVLDAQDQAAEAVAALITHQPDLLVMSDRVAGETGLDLVARARELSPSTRLLVQVDQDTRAPAFEEAGAHLVLSHRSTWQELVSVASAQLPAG